MVKPKGFAELASVPAYFFLKIASAIVLLKICASFLSVSDYGEFAQLVQYGTVLNLLAVGGTQNGLIRQAAAADDDDELAAIHGAALAIWLAASVFVMVLVAGGKDYISSILIGDEGAAPTVVAITALSLINGPGQIWSSILSGRQRVPISLAAQAAGISCSVALAVLFILQGKPHLAAAAFAAGPLLTLLIAGRAMFGLRLRQPKTPAVKRQLLPLLRYSAALAATSGYTALILFALRSMYREHFGSTALGYWIAANRISDMSTQLLGLFIIQFYVSHVAALDDAAERKRFIFKCWAAAVAGMTLVFVVFSFAGRELVALFLSPAFLPAIPVIRVYMVGDILTVWASLAMFTAFARGHPGRFAVIEMATLSLMAAIAAVLIKSGNARAPQLAYASAYAVTALVITVAFAWSARRLLVTPTARKTVSAA
jgi:O-antigen/teichoic acid export membrane protein